MFHIIFSSLFSRTTGTKPVSTKESGTKITPMYPSGQFGKYVARFGHKATPRKEH
jgi:hypothetical protein